MVNRYPSDRVNSFSDAIFSIALTLLILEVKIPSNEDLQAFGTLGVLQKLIPSFIGLLISFFVTAAYWRAHLAFAQYIKEYDGRLLWLTIWLLLFVVFLPFSTGFYAQHFALNGPFIFYCLNLVVIGFFNFLIVNHIIKTDKQNRISPLLAKWLTFRAVVAPIVWLLSIAMLYVNFFASRFSFVMIFVILAIGERRFRKASRAETLLNSIKDQELAAAENDEASDLATRK